MRLRRRSWLVPEILQTSDMDCGPAALKAVMAGCGIEADYEEVRKRCHTDVDGTSMDALAQLGKEFGLDTRLLVVPHEHLMLSQANCLPAIAAIRLTGGLLHFIVIWRRFGPFVQILDPGKGRRWLRYRELLNEIPTFDSPLSPERWRTWADSDDAQAPWEARVLKLGGGQQDAQKLFKLAAKDTTWRSYASLDAGLRFAEALHASGGLAGGKRAIRLVAALVQQQQRQGDGESSIPMRFRWIVPEQHSPDRLRARGCVVLHIADGSSHANRAESSKPSERAPSDKQADENQCIPALAQERPNKRPPEKPLGAQRLDPKRPILSMLLWATKRPLVDFGPPCVAALVIAGIAPLEGLMYRGLMTADHNLGLPYQRGSAMVAMVVFLLAGLALEFGLSQWSKQIGRTLETRLRAQFFSKLPKLPAGFVASRPAADLFERGNSLHLLSDVPVFLFQALSSSLTVFAIGACVVWLVPHLEWVIPVFILTAALPHVATSLVREANQRLRSHATAVQRTHLDALLGGEAIRVHGAESSVEAEFKERLVESNRAATWLHSRTTAVLAVQTGLSFVLAIALLATHIGPGSDTLGLLLLIFWAMRLPASASELSLSLTALRSRTAIALRLITVLAAKEQAHRHGALSVSNPAGLRVELQDVTVETRGKALLQNVTFQIEAGEHVAIVGESGAGKSSLLGLLLGWHEAATGVLRVDGEILDSSLIPSLRDATAWIDPSVQLWDASLYDNIAFGTQNEERVAATLGNGALLNLLDRLPKGMQTILGEGGKLLSGGQGQQVRIGRAALRTDARLVLLDEPFRGLDALARERALGEARERWSNATMLCVSHDIAETAAFERVLVFKGGRVVEQGNPRELLAQPGSHYARLHSKDTKLKQDLYARAGWKTYELNDGHLRDVSGARA